MNAWFSRLRWEWHLVRHSCAHYRMSRAFYRELVARPPARGNRRAVLRTPSFGRVEREATTSLASTERVATAACGN